MDIKNKTIIQLRELEMSMILLWNYNTLQEEFEEKAIDENNDEKYFIIEYHFLAFEQSL